MITHIVVLVVAVAVAGCHCCILHVADGIKKRAEHKESTTLMKFVISIVGRHWKIDKPICCADHCRYSYSTQLLHSYS